MQHATLGDTVYLYFAATGSDGNGADGTSPEAHVRLAGAAADAAPVLSPTPTLLAHADYPDGCYEVAVVASAGNGFAAGNVYAVFSTLAIATENPSGFIGRFQLNASGLSDLVQVDGSNYPKAKDHGGTALAQASELAAARKILEADMVVDTSGSPWQLKFYEAGTANLLLTKDLQEHDGTAVTSTTQVVGKHLQP